MNAMKVLLLSALLLVAGRGNAWQSDTASEAGEAVRELCRQAARAENPGEKAAIYEAAFRTSVAARRLDEALGTLSTLHADVPGYRLDRLVQLLETGVPAEILGAGNFRRMLELARLRLACGRKHADLAARVRAEPRNEACWLELASCSAVLGKWTEAVEALGHVRQTVFSRMASRSRGYDLYMFADESFFLDLVAVAETVDRPYRDFFLHHAAMFREVVGGNWRVGSRVENDIESVKTVFKALGFEQDDRSWTVRARADVEQQRNILNLEYVLRNDVDGLPGGFCQVWTNRTARRHWESACVWDDRAAARQWEKESPLLKREAEVARTELDALCREGGLSNLASQVETTPADGSRSVSPDTAFIRIRVRRTKGLDPWDQVFGSGMPRLVDLGACGTDGALLRRPEEAFLRQIPQWGARSRGRDGDGWIRFEVPVALDPEKDYRMCLGYGGSWYRYSFRTGAGDARNSVPARLLGNMENRLRDREGEEVVCGFAVGQVDWEALMGANPSVPRDRNLPVSNVSFEDCLEFVRRFNALPFSKRHGVEVRIPAFGELVGGPRNLDEMGLGVPWTWTLDGQGDAHVLHRPGKEPGKDARIVRPASYRAPYTGLRLVVKAGPEALAWLQDGK